MGIFDKLKNSAIDTVVSAAGSIGNRAETFTFAALPESLAELRALPEAALDSPFQTAALTVLPCAPTPPTGTSVRRCSTGCAARGP